MCYDKKKVISYLWNFSATCSCSLTRLQQDDMELFQTLIADVHGVLPEWNAALFRAQRIIAAKDEAILETGYQIKANCYVRFVHIPPPESKLPFPNHDQLGLFREVKGIVVRMSDTKLLEVKRDFVCSKCRTVVTVNADYCLMNQFEMPKSCAQKDCIGNMQQKDNRPPRKHCVQYRSVKSQ